MPKYSVNICSHCRQRQLTIVEDSLGIRKCADCVYFNTIGVYTIEQYNNWLIRNNSYIKPSNIQ